MDRDTGRPRGFGVVTMRDDNAACAAIAAMNGKELDGCSRTAPPVRIAGQRPGAER
jgi:hypothetical protein